MFLHKSAKCCNEKSLVILRTQFPIETNGETKTFRLGTLSKCCFAVKKLRTSDCVTEERKRIPADCTQKKKKKETQL